MSNLTKTDRDRYALKCWAVGVWIRIQNLDVRLTRAVQGTAGVLAQIFPAYTGPLSPVAQKFVPFADAEQMGGSTGPSSPQLARGKGCLTSESSADFTLCDADDQVWIQIDAIDVLIKRTELASAGVQLILYPHGVESPAIDSIWAEFSQANGAGEGPDGADFVTFTRRTGGLKLAWLKRQLVNAGITYRMNGRSYHAPITEVHRRDLSRAWDILTPVDDAPDNDPRFKSTPDDNERALWEGFDYSDYIDEEEGTNAHPQELDAHGWPRAHHDAACIVRGPIRVQWTELGEGEDGEYDPDDPNDTEYLRFDVHILFERRWVAIPRASYCTYFPASANDEQRKAGLAILMDAINPVARTGVSLKSICAEMSHIDLTWLPKLDSAICAD